MTEWGTREAAKAWGVSRSTVARWCAARCVRWAYLDQRGALKRWLMPANTLAPKQIRNGR